MKKTILGLLLTCLAAVQWSSSAQDATAAYLVIVHPSNPTTSMSRKDVSRILLKSTVRWDHGEPCEPADQLPKSDVRQDFSKEIHKRSASSVKSFWQHQIFSGGKSPPPELTSDAEVVAWVKSKPGGIGYVSGSANVDGVKVLTVTN